MKNSQTPMASMGLMRLMEIWLRRICELQWQLIKALILASLLISLTGCGFAAAPLVQGSAWVAGTTVKAAEAGRKHSIRAANYIRDQAFTGNGASNRRLPGPPRH